MTFALGCFFLSMTELINIKSFSTYSHPPLFIFIFFTSASPILVFKFGYQFRMVC